MNEQKSKSLDLMKIALAAGKGSVLKSDSNTENEEADKIKEPKKMVKIEYISKLVNNLRKSDQDNFKMLKNHDITRLSFDLYIAQAVQEKLAKDLEKLYE